ncbi:MAG: type II secretion system F family protein [Gammaproteobacteria bacterium]|nr:type II secretion system F family protein [Gammaproteobacteria bacterium]
MPHFSYRGRNPRGELVQGSIEAATADTVASQLMNTGVTPIDIAESEDDQAEKRDILGRAFAKRPGLDDLILFSRQMFILMKSGVPITRAMTGLIQSTRNPYMVDALRDVLADIESGHELGSALARHPDIFSTLFVSMVRVGENTGRLEEAFQRISQYLELEKDTRQRVKAALRYPFFVLAAIAVAITIINIFVIPAFADLFARADVDLPWQTRLIMTISDIFVNWWPLMLLGVIGGYFGFRSYIATERGRYWWDKTKLQLPLVGDIIKRAILGRFARAFSMALKSGVPLVQALTVVARSVDNDYIAEDILDMRNGIERGESLTRTAAMSGQFTPLVLQMLAVGEETGEVDRLLAEVADYYEREVDYDIRNLSSTIEPVMIIAIGVMVLILALGVFLPMWDMSKVI